MESPVTDTSQDTVLEPSRPDLSTLSCPITPTRIREPRYTSEELSRKRMLKRQRDCRCCAGCGFWKHNVGFIRSLAPLGSPRFELRMFRTCNQCSRLRKGLDEDEHLDLYGGVDFNP